jgi:hypothetical protein
MEEKRTLPRANLLERMAIPAIAFMEELRTGHAIPERRTRLEELRMNRLQENLARHLSDSVERLQKQVEKVDFWASALTGFAQPVPEYEPESTKVGRYVRPGRLPRKRRHRSGTRGKPKDVTPASA